MNRLNHQATTCLLVATLLTTAAPADVPRANPAAVGMDAQRLDAIDALVTEHIERGKTPGCVVTIGHAGRVVFQRAYGHRQLRPDKVPMTVDTVFDLASLTKPIATGSSIMVLIDRGRLRLSDKIAMHIPEFGENGKDGITVRQLLTHVGGLVADNPLADYTGNVEQAWQNIWKLDLFAEPDEKFIYTDVGFIVLAKLVERISGKNVDAFARQNVFIPLGMKETGYLPAASLRDRAATTEQRDGRWMKGEVHDPRAFALGGIAGHAGLFSTADDLAIYAQMMLSQGRSSTARVLSRRAVEVMTSQFPTPRGTRGLGWDIQSPYSSNRSDLYSHRAFGHGGFTGTAIWMDPELDLFVIFLANRVHPDGQGHVNYLASRIGSVAVSALGDQQEVSLEFGGGLKVESDHPAGRPHDVLCGVDQLERDDFAALAGKRVGLITNHTGLNRAGVSTVRLLHQAPNVELVRLFSPEHGIAGRLDIADIADSEDETTGLPVFSLYGKTRKPTAESLADLDVLVFDIQDIGARFYTYVSTMGLAMEAAAEHDVDFMILDRPNPIGGVTVDGPVLDAGQESFVGFHTLPVQHGMTVGEIGKLFQAESKASPDLVVIPVSGWHRGQLWDATGLVWTNPSPNMRCLTQAVLYPGIGLLETTNFSVGRGTDTPFEVIGAPWIRGRELAATLNERELSGVRFVPVRFTPTSSKFAGQPCEGVNIVITHREILRAVPTGLEIAVQLRRQYKDDWDIANLNRLLANQDVYTAIKNGVSADEIIESYQDSLREFMARRARCLIYD